MFSSLLENAFYWEILCFAFCQEDRTNNGEMSFVLEVFHTFFKHSRLVAPLKQLSVSVTYFQHF